MKFEKATVFFKTRKHNLFDTKNIPQLQKTLQLLCIINFARQQ